MTKKLRPHVKRLNLKRSRRRMSQPTIVSGTGYDRRSLDGKVLLKNARRKGRTRIRSQGRATLLLFLLLPLFMIGCTHNLQASYVSSMEAAHYAITLDVKAGLYKPDRHGRATLAAMKKANEDARAALKERVK